MEPSNPFQAFFDLVFFIILQALEVQYQVFFALFEILEAVGVIA